MSSPKPFSKKYENIMENLNGYTGFFDFSFSATAGTYTQLIYARIQELRNLLKITKGQEPEVEKNPKFMAALDAFENEVLAIITKKSIKDSNELLKHIRDLSNMTNEFYREKPPVEIPSPSPSLESDKGDIKRNLDVADTNPAKPPVKPILHTPLGPKDTVSDTVSESEKLFKEFAKIANKITDNNLKFTAQYIKKINDISVWKKSYEPHIIALKNLKGRLDESTWKALEEPIASMEKITGKSDTDLMKMMGKQDIMNEFLALEDKLDKIYGMLKPKKPKAQV